MKRVIKWWIVTILLFTFTLSANSSYVNEWSRLNSSAKQYMQNDQYDKALSLSKKMLEVSKKIKPISYRKVIISLYNIATVYSALLKNEESLKYYNKALVIAKKHNIKDSSYATILSGMADIEYANKEYENAIRHYKKAIELLTKTLGKSDKHTLRAMQNLSSLYSDIQEYEKSIEIYKKLLKYSIKKYGKNNNFVLSILNDYAFLYISINELDKAKKWLLEATDILNKIKNPSKLELAELYSSYSAFYYKSKDFDKAIKYSKKAVEVSKKSFGNSNITVSYLENLALIYRGVGKEVEAKTVDEIIADIKSGKSETQIKSSKKDCSKIDLKEAKKTLTIVHNRFPNISKESIDSLGLRYYYSKDNGVVILSPSAWSKIDTKNKNVILYLENPQDSNRNRFVLQKLDYKWDNEEFNNPKMLLKNVAKEVGKMSYVDAKDIADIPTPPLTLLPNNGYSLKKRVKITAYICKGS